MLGFPFLRSKKEAAPNSAREASVTAPVLSAPDRGPWVIREWSGPGSIVLQSQDPKHEASLILDGVFEDTEQRYAYANALVDWLNQQLATAQIEHVKKSPPVTAADFAAQRIDTDMAALGLGAEPEEQTYVPQYPQGRAGVEPLLYADAQPGPAADGPHPGVPDTEPLVATEPPAGLYLKPSVTEEPPKTEARDTAPKPAAPSLTEKVTRLLSTSSWPTRRAPPPAQPARAVEPMLTEPTSDGLPAEVIEPVLEAAPPQVIEPASTTMAAQSLPSAANDQAGMEAKVPRATKVERAAPQKWGCHCDLQPGQQPDSCVIDLGQPEYCAIASSGVRKEACVHWQPIVIVRKAA